MKDLKIKKLVYAVLTALFAMATVAQAGAAQTAAPAAPVGGQQKMILEKVSTFGHEETVKKITDATRVGEWVVSGVKQLDKSILKNGGPKVLPVTLVEICNAEHAGKILLDDSSRWASVMMTCTLAVYDKNDGKPMLGS